MRYGSDHKKETRKRVLAAASAEIRAAGPEGIGVAQLMAKAGLTHGGFYAHFKSKDDLIAQAVAQMFDDSHGRFVNRTDVPDPAEALANFIEYYLSARHRDAPEGGCPLPSLSGEVARMQGPARARFGAGIERLTDAIAALLRRLERPDADKEAASIVSELVGAMALARATADAGRSDGILAASRERLKRRLEPGSP